MAYQRRNRRLHRVRSTLLSHQGRLRRRPAGRTPSPAPQPTALNEEQQRRAAEIEQELQLARDLQQGLLLEAAPRLTGWELTAISLPARDLGGDLYDFLPLGNGTHGIMIGDVSGKGLAAALRMAVARTVFRHEARRDDSPAPTLAAVNRGVLSEIPHGMVTMLYARLDTTRGELFVANAGHTFPLLVNGQVHELELSGLPLGVDSDSDYVEARVQIAPGDSVVLYTDGVLEAENDAGEIFSYERLHALVSANRHLKPRALVARLLQELRAWSVGSQSDDITMVVLRRRLSDLHAELRSVSEDVLGPERADALWAAIDGYPERPHDAESWLAFLPDLIGMVQARYGRGLARELNQQLRLTLEDYRR
jgi:sigma-B regulation protein RsbU (phosphoserine phosphatase)